MKKIKKNQLEILSGVVSGVAKKIQVLTEFIYKNEPNYKTIAAGKTDKCKAHGGGKRCIVSAIDKTNKCVAHGGENLKLLYSSII